MIEVVNEEHRFYTGDTIHYIDAPTSALMETATEAEDPAMRLYAANGLMRALLSTSPILRDDLPFVAAIGWTRDVIMDVQATRDITDPHPDVEDCVRNLPNVTGVWDSVSVTATATNIPKATETFIGRHIYYLAPKLVIGLGHGGIVSSLATYATMEGDNVFYPVRFSQHKAKDQEPVFSAGEAELLRDLAQDREVIIHDEDRGLRASTIREAVRSFAKFFEKDVWGVTPVLARHPHSYWPQIVWSDAKTFMKEATYNNRSQELREILDEVARQEIYGSPSSTVL